jgi:hypothetical protein
MCPRCRPARRNRSAACGHTCRIHLSWACRARAPGWARRGESHPVQRRPVRFDRRRTPAEQVDRDPGLAADPGLEGRPVRYDLRRPDWLGLVPRGQQRRIHAGRSGVGEDPKWPGAVQPDRCQQGGAGGLGGEVRLRHGPAHRRCRRGVVFPRHRHGILGRYPGATAVPREHQRELAGDLAPGVAACA